MQEDLNALYDSCVQALNDTVVAYEVSGEVLWSLILREGYERTVWRELSPSSSASAKRGLRELDRLLQLNLL